MNVRNPFRTLFPIMLMTGVSSVAAQSPLDEMVVTGTRTEQNLGDVPLAISLVSMRDIQLGRQGLNLDESLARVPGLFMQIRYTFAQDLRVSIRGFGSRASFGIRGIKVFADGIPVTLPDGQSGTDDLDIGSAESIEVIRGPSASLYGTASGGVISLTTEEPPAEPFVETKLTAGEFGHQKYQFKTGGQSGRLGYLINTSYMEMDGFRDHSEVEHGLINSKFRYDIDDTSSLTAIVNAVDWSALTDGPEKFYVAPDRIGDLGTADFSEGNRGLRNHIEVDLVRRASEGKETQPEAYAFEDGWLTSLGASVAHPQITDRRAVIIVTLDNKTLPRKLQ